MNTHLLLATLLLAPVVGFLFNGVRFRSKNANISGGVATLAAVISFFCAATLFAQIHSLPDSMRTVSAAFYQWIPVGHLNIDAGFVVDQISAVMILIITGVGSLIHLFSIGYMAHDDRPAQYFAYLNLFLFNMLVLVLGNSLVITFVGWEGVGLCSYLLVGFWFTDSEKAAAGMKAFIANRVGDTGFLIGMFILFYTFGTLNYHELLGRAAPLTAELGAWGPVSWACLFLFIGATGKSAQIPLYVWLPDAMAGPTPVSALIHAATMVTAGIYMIVRMSGIYMLAPDVMMIIAWIGALTAFFAATIGMTQWDIKKVLAYSTISQLGYMFLGVGVGAFSGAMFHLMTHAFFKGLMFLGSGSVIHAMSGEQDMRKMGGLAKYMPVTHLTFAAGWLAIIGFPPFAGFFSKDEILWYAFHSPHGSKILWFIGLAGAACTAFYMTRLMCLTFWGKTRFGHDVHPHESPMTMKIPLIVLGVLSLVGGWVGIPHTISAILPGHPGNVFEHWLAPALATVHMGEGSALIEWSLMGISVGLVCIAAWIAYDGYIMNPGRLDGVVSRIKPVYELVYNKYFVDEFYFGNIINPLVDLSKALWLYIDSGFVDKITYFVSDLTVGMADFGRTLQNGKTQQYALYMALGLVIAMTFVLVGS